MLLSCSNSNKKLKETMSRVQGRFLLGFYRTRSFETFPLFWLVIKINNSFLVIAKTTSFSSQSCQAICHLFILFSNVQQTDWTFFQMKCLSLSPLNPETKMATSVWSSCIWCIPNWTFYDNTLYMYFNEYLVILLYPHTCLFKNDSAIQ